VHVLFSQAKFNFTCVWSILPSGTVLELDTLRSTFSCTGPLGRISKNTNTVLEFIWKRMQRTLAGARRDVRMLFAYVRFLLVLSLVLCSFSSSCRFPEDRQ
jgi:hypothetical protein